MEGLGPEFSSTVLCEVGFRIRDIFCVFHWTCCDGLNQTIENVNNTEVMKLDLLEIILPVVWMFGHVIRRCLIYLWSFTMNVYLYEGQQNRETEKQVHQLKYDTMWLEKLQQRNNPSQSVFSLLYFSPLVLY